MSAALWLLVATALIVVVIAGVIVEEQHGRWQAKGRR